MKQLYLRDIHAARNKVYNCMRDLNAAIHNARATGLDVDIRYEQYRVRATVSLPLANVHLTPRAQDAVQK